MRTRLLTLVAAGLAASIFFDSASGDPAGISTAAQNGGTRKQDVKEEVTITAHKEKLWRLQKEINKSLDSFFDTFNEINTVPAYRTYCSDVIPIDSHIPRHVCTPKFFNDATEDEAEGFMLRSPAMMARMLVAVKMPAYKKHMQDLIHKDPRVRKAALDFEALFERYQAVTKEKVKGQ